MNRIN